MTSTTNAPNRCWPWAGWVPGLLVYLAANLVLLTAWRWWTLAELGVGPTSVLRLTPPVSSVLAVAGLLVLPALAGYAAVHLFAPQWRRAIGAALVGLVAIAVVAAGARAGVETRACQNGPARASTHLGTGLGLGCLRLIYRSNVNTAHLPTGPVIWLDDTDHTRTVLDLATGTVHDVDNSLYYGWQNTDDCEP